MRLNLATRQEVVDMNNDMQLLLLASSVNKRGLIELPLNSELM